ncbi:MAG: excinuclease ABC subunit UvrA [Tidjanibacter sp.]|nr:excinuclease ABC subunit UvrA [Tidjanibacter sp.]
MKQKYNSIYIRGARVHNLKNIEVEIPHNQLVVVTGLSGSGKSTLAFDTIFAEGQRRYVESLSTYARQFLGRVEKPDVDIIRGIAPAIAIEQKVTSRNPRSTVGTSTEIYDYLKLLFARIGRTFSPISGREVVHYQAQDVVERIASLPEGEAVLVAAPFVLREGERVIEKITLLMEEGVQRFSLQGEMMLAEDFVQSVGADAEPKDIMVVVDRLRTSHEEELLSRAGDSVARAMEIGDGVCLLVVSERVEEYSSRFEIDGITFEEPTEHLFSFNNPIGACPVCEGYGKVVGIDENLVVPDKNKSVFENAIACWRGASMSWFRDRLVENAHRFDFPVHAPYYALTKEQKRLLWTGNEYFHGLDEFFKMLEKERYKVQYRVMLSRFTGKTLCPECEGTRLRREALYVKVGGRNIAELVQMPVDELIEFFASLSLTDHELSKAERVLKEIQTRLQYVADVGLGYLTLDRLSSTLSGGESQRINLSTSLGSNLTGSLYILDEPSIGLHPRDTHKLIGVLRKLRNMGNTVIVVEHEEEVIRAADRIVDIGPEAGVNGGEVVYNGSLSEIANAERSLTADYLLGRKSIPMPTTRRGWSSFVEISGARENNLKNIDVKIPLGVMTCVTGVSGSGKSSLVEGILYPALRRHIYETGNRPGGYTSLGGDLGLIRSVEMVDQSPIGKSLRSNPVTYTKAYNDIRQLFAQQPYAKHNGITQSHFSFNRPGGRCEECQGEGVIRVEMQFMADVELRCEHCGGKRFNDEVLEVRYRGKSISDVLEMSVDDAIAFFGEESEPLNKRIVATLSTLQSVGLGYIKLGQSTSTLSGGEIQRVKLASYLMGEDTTEGTMFIFDEPTTGLHFHDIGKLLAAFDALLRKGHTIVVIEHNMEVIKCADWVIDLGPEAGDGGGNLVFEGTPDNLVKCKDSYTGQFLAQHIAISKEKE